MSITDTCFFFAIASNLFSGITPEEFKLEYQWTHINYTWTSRFQYQDAVSSEKYIPENIFPTGVKFHGDRLFLATPSYRKGVPFTLSYVLRSAKDKTNTPLIPFPNAVLHRENNCSYLQNVQTLEIDRKGIMWVLDGVRMSGTTNCPGKLQQFDLNRGGVLIHTYVFPDEICLRNGCFLNDLVVDDEDHIYITDASNIDPGLVVYCRTDNKAWKFRDSSMFPQKDGPKYSIDNYPVLIPVPIDGIALSPIPGDKLKKSRVVYYCPLTGYDLFSVAADILRNETLHHSGLFRNYIVRVGKKQGATDGMMMDNTGNLYYSLTSHNAVGRWNIHESFDQSEVIYRNNRTLIWPDAFGMDQKGYLYVMANRAFDYLAPNVELNFTSEIKFRIFKYYTGSRSYLYPNF
ncbi:protein yellow [Leptinotarsa decemlineata]|uniref:protein yellow n=1 Tax=Leptinotarsa decemlineata TaxID=7539 RepID=UPI003D30A5B2